MKLVIVLLFCMTASCASARKHKRSDSHITPAGYEVVGIQDQGSFSGHLLTYSQVLETLDKRIAEWIALHPEHAALPGRVKYRFWDHWRFEVGSGEGAAGATDARNARIDLCIYTYVKSVNKPATLLSWTVIQHDGMYYVADAPTLPATAHELDHLVPGAPPHD